MEWSSKSQKRKERRKKGERKRGEENVRVREWGVTWWFLFVAKWHGTTYLAQFFSSRSMSSSLCINAQSPFPLLCTMLLPLDLMISPWESNRSHNHFFLIFLRFLSFLYFLGYDMRNYKGEGGGEVHACPPIYLSNTHWVYEK